jgi:hypothetical protein
MWHGDSCALQCLAGWNCHQQPAGHAVIWVMRTLSGFVVCAMQAEICEQLDSALLTDEEMQMYDSKWASLPDPEHAGA